MDHLEIDINKQKIGARVLGFLRGTKSGRDLESVIGTTVLDNNLVEYIQGDQELSEAYDEGKEAGVSHKKPKLNQVNT